MRRASLALAGGFVIGGLLLFAVGLFIIGDRRMLFADHVEVYAEFARLGALQNGAKVRVAGMDAGEVLEMRVPPGPQSKFRVKMRVREDLHALVRNDSVATIQTDGLVGSKFVQIDAGTERAPQVADGGTVKSREPFDFGDLLQQASETIALITTTINDLKGDVERTVEMVAETAEHTDRLIEDVGVDVKAISAAGTRIVRDTQTIVDNVRAGRGTIGKLLHDEELYRRTADIARQAEVTVVNLREASAEARRALTDIRSKEGPVQGVASDFRQTLSAAREAMADLAENAEALKRNFLFRGFFRRRGYFDLDAIGVDEYRSGVLEKEGRAVRRIWLNAAMLFGRDASGVQQLTDGGKARLDSAMAVFVDEARTKPLMIEGYAPGVTRDEQYLEARARAVIVREYLINRFHLDPQRVGFIPLGDRAVNSPSGDRWDGVALALFTDQGR